MIKKLFFLSLSILIIYTLMSSCQSKSGEESSDEEPPPTEEAPVILTPKAEPYLQEDRDAGEDYINSFVFLGESTTYHLKSRGVLNGGSDTKQVWAPKSGTLMLDSTTANCRIVYPETGEEMDLATAVNLKKPQYMLLTFGLNGAVKTVSKGSEYFKSCYGKLIDCITDASPRTVVLLQSCFPVAERMDTSAFSVSPKKLNQYIDVINGWAAELAEERSLGFINSCEVLKDGNGALRDEYQVGDGYHLTTDAYVEILKYIRTHPWKEKSYED